MLLPNIEVHNGHPLLEGRTRGYIDVFARMSEDPASVRHPEPLATSVILPRSTSMVGSSRIPGSQSRDSVSIGGDIGDRGATLPIGFDLRHTVTHRRVMLCPHFWSLHPLCCCSFPRGRGSVRYLHGKLTLFARVTVQDGGTTRRSCDDRHRRGDRYIGVHFPYLSPSQRRYYRMYLAGKAVYPRSRWIYAR